MDELEPKIPGKKIKNFFLSLHRISGVDKIFFLQHLEVLVRTGFSLSVALETVAQSVTKPFFKTVIFSLQSDIEHGKTFSEGLALYPNLFPEIFRSMVHAGEVSGKLDVALKQLLIQQRKRHDLIVKMKNALTYPIVVLSAMLIIGTGIIIFVFPKITMIYEDATFELPLPTRIVIGLSNLLTQKGLIVLVGIVLLAVIIHLFYRSERGKTLSHRLFLRLPVVGNILKKICLATFARNLSSLLKTDIPINKIFEIISHTIPLIPYRQKLALVGRELEKGVMIYTILDQDPRLFPPLLTRIISTGEKTGMLDSLTEEIAVFYEADVGNTLENLSTMIEPILMLVLGFLVGGFAVSIILPFYKLVENM